MIDTTPTERQAAFLRYINSFQRRNLYPPSFRDFMRRFGITSTNGVRDHLVLLERKQLIVRRPKRARALRITARGLKSIGVAL